MHKAQRIQLGFIGFALFYAVVGNYSWYTAQTEYFPIYSWDLFSYIPSYAADFAVRLTEVNGAEVDPPVYFNEAHAYVPVAKSIEAFALIQTFGRAVYENNGDTERLQEQFEALYFGHLSTVTYELVIRAYDPLQFSQSGTLDEVTLLQTFQVQP